MKIAVIGAGGVGGYFGAKLAKAGHEVQFLARGEHMKAMQSHGLRIQGDAGSFSIDKPSVTDDARQLAVPDVILVATKLWDLAATGRQLAPMVGDRTVVVPFQNGVDAVDLLGESIPAERIAAGVAYISAVIGSPGVIVQTGMMARLRVGALHPSQEAALRRFVDEAGFEAEFVQDPARMLWEKFTALNAMSGMTAMTRQTVGFIRADSDLRNVFEAAFRECIDLAARHGVHLSPEFAAGTSKMLDTLPENMRASMAHDLIAGRRLEAPWLCGAVVRRAAKYGLPVPVNATIWAALKPFAEGAPAA